VIVAVAVVARLAADGRDAGDEPHRHPRFAAATDRQAHVGHDLVDVALCRLCHADDFDVGVGVGVGVVIRART